MKILIVFLLLFSALKAKTQQTYDRVIDSLYHPDEPGGVALVAQHGHILYQRAFGMADMELGVKMQPEMLFEIGSMTKQFTAVCILQLAEQGKLRTGDSLSKYIDSCPPAWQGIKLEHLLTHTSGIIDLSGPMGNLNEILKMYKDRALSFSPGTKRVYSNIGYALFGFVIEKVSGEPYPDYLQQHILKPLGLDHTVYGNTTTIIPGRVPCYIRSKNGKAFHNAVFNLQTSAAGALLSNVADLWKWNSALTGGQVISKNNLERAWTSYHLADGKNTHYGYGWQTEGFIQGSLAVEHGGVAVGYLTDALYVPEEDIFVAVFSNQRGVVPEIPAAKLAAIALGKPDTMHVIPTDEKTLQAYIGTYKEEEDTTARQITLVANHLYYQRSDGPRLEMKRFGPDQFLFDNTSVTGLFKRDDKKQVIGLSLFELRHPGEPSTIFQKERNNLLKQVVFLIIFHSSFCNAWQLLHHCNIAVYFIQPPFSSCFGYYIIFTVFMSMPKAAVYKNYRFVFW